MELEFQFAIQKSFLGSGFSAANICLEVHCHEVRKLVNDDS